MTKEQHDTLQQLRYLLRKSGCFAFEKNGTFLLYRQSDVPGERNTLILSHRDVHVFYKKARVAAGV